VAATVTATVARTTDGLGGTCLPSPRCFCAADDHGAGPASKNALHVHRLPKCPSDSSLPALAEGGYRKVSVVDHCVLLGRKCAVAGRSLLPAWLASYAGIAFW